MQFLGHRLSGPLVIRIHLVAEGRFLQIKSHRQMIWLLLLEDLKHNIEEPVYRIGMKTLRVCQFRHPVKRAV